MARSAGVSGLGLGLATAGAIVAYAGFKGIPPREVLRAIAAGEAPGNPARAGKFASWGSSLASTVSPVDALLGTVPNQAASGAARGRAGQFVAAVQSQIGKPYRWGGTGPNAYDCSGLLVWGLREIGVKDVPRFTTATFGAWASSVGGRKLKRSEIVYGDVVVRTGHMGLAISNARMVHSPRVGKPVQEADIYGPQGAWWGWRLFTPEPPGGEASPWRGI